MRDAFMAEIELAACVVYTLLLKHVYRDLVNSIEQELYVEGEIELHDQVLQILTIYLVLFSTVFQGLDWVNLSAGWEKSNLYV